MTSFTLTNREWVTLHRLWKAVSSHIFHDQQQVSDIAHLLKAISSHFFLWPTASKWHCTFCEMQSHHIFLWPTGSKWLCIFCEWQSHHIFSDYDWQEVSDIAHFVKSNPITSFPMVNSLWVTLHILWKAVSLHLFLWPTESEWCCIFWENRLITSSPMTNKLVSDIAHVVNDSLTMSFLWPTACEWHWTFVKRSHHIFFLCPTASEWHHPFCERQSHWQIFSYDQQQVSDIPHAGKGCYVRSRSVNSRLTGTVGSSREVRH